MVFELIKFRMQSNGAVVIMIGSWGLPQERENVSAALGSLEVFVATIAFHPLQFGVLAAALGYAEP